METITIILIVLLLLFGFLMLEIVENREWYCRVYLRKEWKLYEKLIKEAKEFKFIREDANKYVFQKNSEYYAFVYKEPIVRLEDETYSGTTCVYTINNGIIDKCVLCGYCAKQSNRLGEALMKLKESRGE